MIQISLNEKTPNVNNFKNKENFCNRLIEQITNIIRDNNIDIQKNKRFQKLDNQLKILEQKNNKLDMLLKKSNSMKKNIEQKVDEITESNNTYRDNLIERL